MAGFKDEIYSVSPVFLQSIAINLFGYGWKKRRFGGVFVNELVSFKEREKYTASDWKNYQELELRKLLKHAIETVPIYRELYAQSGILKDEIDHFSLVDLRKLPTVTKAQLREFCKDKFFSEAADDDGEFFTTSGSTGTPTSIYYSKYMHQRLSAAFEVRGRNWAGLNHKMARGMIGGRPVVSSKQTKPPFYRYNYFEKQVYFSINHLSKKNAHDYVYAINKYKVEYLTGYAISNYLLATYIEDNGMKVRPLKAVLTSSEKLTPVMRDTFRRVYGCETFDGYGSVEACGLITNCEYGKYHVSPDVGIVELINSEGNTCGPGEIGDIVSTGLLNFDQPLIRYKIGDLAMFAHDQSCKCGRQMTIIEEIVGRTDDIVTMKDGRQLGSFNRFFANIHGIAETQVIQEDFDFFVINLVPTENFSQKTMDEIHSVFKERLGEAKITVVKMDRIPRLDSGKFKAVISKV